jgi:hypothetical protein
VLVIAAAGCASARARGEDHDLREAADQGVPRRSQVHALHAGEGLPFPMPDAAGNFHLSYRRERALKKAATQRERNAADAVASTAQPASHPTSSTGASAK